MNNISNLRDTVIPKSDQLNADDLIGTSRTVTITNVSRGSLESPLNIDFAGSDGRPFKPCKSMRRLMIFAWGEDGQNWIGRSMTLFTDPAVVYAGKAVGGIRISHMSNIAQALSVKLTATRGKKTEYRVEVLQQIEKPAYPADKFNANLPKMGEAITAGKMTTEQVINQCESSGSLTEEQRAEIRAFDSDPFEDQ